MAASTTFTNALAVISLIKVTVPSTFTTDSTTLLFKVSYKVNVEFRMAQ